MLPTFLADTARNVGGVGLCFRSFRRVTIGGEPESGVDDELALHGR
jgi:hypothetical protein